MTVAPSVGLRCWIAIPSAFDTRAAVGCASIDQPTTRRLNTSRTTAQYTLPSLVGCSVMSVTQSWSRFSRANCRCTRSSAVATLGTRRYRGRPESPCRPALRIRRSTVWRPTEIFCPSVSSAWTRRTPYVPRDSACARRMSSVNHVCRRALADGARFSHS